jgi:hypothetical protein
MAAGTVIDSEGFGWSLNANDYVTYASMALTNGGGPNPTIVTGGAFGDNFMQNNGNGRSQRNFPKSLLKFTVACRLFVPANQLVIGVTDAFNTWQVMFMFNPGGAANQLIQVFSGNTFPTNVGTSIGITSGISFPIAQWFHFAADVVLDAVNGYVCCYINGVELGTLGLIGPTNTMRTSSAPGDIFCNTGSTGGGLQSGWMHYYLMDQTAQTGPPPWGNPFGAPRIQTLLPSGAGLHTAFTPTGQPTNWQNAASVPPNPSVDFNSSSTVGAQDNFAIAGLDTTFGTIFCANVKTIAGVTTGGVRTYASDVISAGTLAQGATVALGSPVQIPAIFQNDPATGSPFTPSAIEAAEPGYIIVS